VIGVLFSLILVLRALAFPHDAVLVRAGEKGGFHNRQRYPEARGIPGLILYRFSGPLFFANASQFRDRVDEVLAEATPPVHGFILDAAAIVGVDLAACETLDDIQKELHNRGIRLVIADLRSFVRERLLQGWERAASVPDLFAPDLESAIEGFSPSHRS
jgi:SulP family sulfate permease